MMKALATITFVLIALGASAAVAQDPPSHPAKVGETCGGGGDLQCETGLWCDLHGRCDETNASGTCVKVPDTCTEDLRPVCACGGASYDNDCKRQKARARLDPDGKCSKKESQQPGERKGRTSGSRQPMDRRTHGGA